MDTADDKKGQGIVVKSWGAVAVKAAADKPNGYIRVKGKVENTAPIMMRGVVNVKVSNESKSAEARQGVFCVGQFLKGKVGPADKDFDMRFEIADIGAIGTKWKLLITSGNMLGMMNTQFKKEAEVTVQAMAMEPSPPSPPPIEPGH